MRWRSDSPQPGDVIHFFVSYSPLDERWATWVAWELELAGYRTMLQAWDFVPGTNFIDFMDRGVSESIAVVAILSRSYVQSRYGRLEWQAALRSAPDNPESRLITVRVEDFPIEGLLSTITFLDLVAVDDPRVARSKLLGRIREAIQGRAKPAAPPAAYPLGARPERVSPARVTMLLLPGPRFGTSPGLQDHAKELFEALAGAVEQLSPEDRPDAVAITGDLTGTGGLREFDTALGFLAGLRSFLGIPPHRIAIVPGPADLTLAACRAYFANCEADEVEPQPPYWPKWRHYRRFFANLYEGVDGPEFTEHHPWTLYEMADLNLVVAGLNSTMAMSHHEADRYGWIGRAQAHWFARQLRGYAGRGWIRIGAMGHPPAELRDADAFRTLVADQLDTLFDRTGSPRLVTFVTHPRDGRIDVADRTLAVDP
jgi:hypothetical protein